MSHPSARCNLCCRRVGSRGGAIALAVGVVVGSAMVLPLLSDPEHKVAEAYGVWGEKKLYGRAFMGIIRSAFLIDEKGKVEQAWYKVSPKDTPKKLLAALDQ